MILLPSPLSGTGEKAGAGKTWGDPENHLVQKDIAFVNTLPLTVVPLPMSLRNTPSGQERAATETRNGAEIPIRLRKLPEARPWQRAVAIRLAQEPV